MNKATNIIIGVLVAAIVVVGGLAMAKTLIPPSPGPTADEIDRNNLPGDVAMDVVEPSGSAEVPGEAA